MRETLRSLPKLLTQSVKLVDEFVLLGEQFGSLTVVLACLLPHGHLLSQLRYDLLILVCKPTL